MTITDEVLRLLARATTTRLLAIDPHDHGKLHAAEATLVSVFRATLHDAYPNEVIRLYAGARAQRQQQRDRIRQALQAGESAAAVAKREQVSERWVRTLRPRGTIRP